MIRREHFCNKLLELGYTFERQADRVLLYRKRGAQDRVTVRRRDLLDEDYVRSTLRQAGCTPDSIETFIAVNRQNNNH